MDWPIYQANQIVIGNLDSPVAITTLWTNRDTIISRIDSRLYAAVGTLYNRKVGIDPLIRNLLARPQIKCLVICGQDSARSGEALIKFFRHGFERGNDSNGNPKWIIPLSEGDYGLIDIEVEEEALQLLRKNASFVDMRGIDDGSIVAGTLKDLNGNINSHPYSEPKIFPKVIPSVSSFPAPDSGRVFRSPTVVGAWLQAIHEIYRFGVVGETHYNPATEVLTVVTVITKEDPENPFIPEWLPIGRKEIEAYSEQVLTPVLSPGTRYGYGHRLFRYFGYDQIEAAVQKLAEDPDSKSAVASIWDPAKDVGDLVNPKSPCVNHIWFRLRRGKLYLTATIRSNDMGEAYLGNAFALRRLQAKTLEMLKKRLAEKPHVIIVESENLHTGEKHIREMRFKPGEKEIERIELLGLGDLVINSESAHLYESSWVNVEETLKRHWKEVMKGPALRKDPYGSFQITIEDKKIVVSHLSPTEELLRQYRGTTALQLSTMLVEEGIISEPYHAVYLGRELEKAEMALRLGVNYVQDQPLFPVHGPKPRIMLNKP